jgi:hypothetical protein
VGSLNFNRGPSAANAADPSQVETGRPNPDQRSTLVRPLGEQQATADDLGIDVDRVQQDVQNGVADLETHFGAAYAGVTTDTKGRTYSSHPIQNFAVGAYQFAKGVLTLLDGDAIEEFESLISKLPAPDRLLIKTIDLGKAEEIAKGFTVGGATKAFDSSVGRAALEKLAAGAQTIGTVELGQGTDSLQGQPKPGDNTQPGQNDMALQAVAGLDTADGKQVEPAPQPPQTGIDPVTGKPLGETQA